MFLVYLFIFIIWFVSFRIAAFFFQKAIIMLRRHNPGAPLLVIAGVIFSIIAVAIAVLGVGVGLLDIFGTA